MNPRPLAWSFPSISIVSSTSFASSSRPAAPRIRYRCTKGELACSPHSPLLSHPRTMLAKSSIQANTKPKRSSSGFHSGNAFTTSHHRGRKNTMELFSSGPSALPSLLLAGQFTLPPSPPVQQMPASKSNQSINHGLCVGSEVSLFREDDTIEEGEEEKNGRLTRNNFSSGLVRATLITKESFYPRPAPAIVLPCSHSFLSADTSGLTRMCPQECPGY